MEKEYKKIELGEGLVKHKVVLQDTPSSGSEKTFRQLAFLKEFIEGVYSGVSLCGPGFFDVLKVHHIGGRWVAELEFSENVLE